MKQTQKFFLALFLLFFWTHSTLGAPTITLNAEQALQELVSGNERFVSGRVTHPNQNEIRRHELTKGQSPFAAVLGCSDSRTAIETIFDQGLGDIFVARVAGNILDDAVLGSLEYGVAQLGVPLIVVLGHEKCGAVEAALKPDPLPGHIEGIAATIRQSISTNTCPSQNKSSCATQVNVRSIVEKLKNSEPLIAPLVKSGKVRIVGAFYHLNSGKVELLDP